MNRRVRTFAPLLRRALARATQDVLPGISSGSAVSARLGDQTRPFSAAYTSTHPIIMAQTEEFVVLFDGVCNFLQSQAAQPLIKACGIPPEEVMNSFVLVRRQPGFLPEEGVDSDSFTFYRASTAALQIGSRLDRPFSLLAPVALWIPAPLRDAVYYCVARNRYSVFGKSDSCMMPTAALRKRFLDWGEKTAAPAPAAAATESQAPAARVRSQPRRR